MFVLTWTPEDVGFGQGIHSRQIDVLFVFPKSELIPMGKSCTQRWISTQNKKEFSDNQSFLEDGEFILPEVNTQKSEGI